MVKIAFFDIDGTLLRFGETTLRPAVANALRRLRASGVKIFLATGRTPYMIPVFDGVTFDGALTFNGSYCYNETGVLYSHPMDRAEIGRVIANAKEAGLATVVATATRTGANFYQEALDKYMRFSKFTCDVAKDFEQIQQEDVYQLMIAATADKDEALLCGTSRVRIVRWWDYAVDVIPADSGKATGMEKILEHYGFDRAECIAFGDGGNDLDMIQYAGCGVAMGNATKEVKAAADYITDDVDHDGVVTALRELKVL